MRMLKKQKIFIFVLVLGIIYSLIVRYTPFCIPCFFQMITGLRCPGCGITHLILYLMDFQLYDAYCANRFLFITSPILVLILILNFFCKDEIRTMSFTKRLTLFYAYGLVAWGVVRNIL